MQSVVTCTWRCHWNSSTSFDLSSSSAQTIVPYTQRLFLPVSLSGCHCTRDINATHVVTLQLIRGFWAEKLVLGASMCTCSLVYRTYCVTVIQTEVHTAEGRTRTSTYHFVFDIPVLAHALQDVQSVCWLLCFSTSPRCLCSFPHSASHSDSRDW